MASSPQSNYSPEPADGSPGPSSQQHEPARWELFDDIETIEFFGSELDLIEELNRIFRDFRSWPGVRRKLRNEDLDHPKLKGYVKDMKKFIAVLASIDMTPRIKLGAHVDSTWVAFNNKEKRFPQFLVACFNHLYDDWKADDFGAITQEEADSQPLAQDEATSTVTAATPAARVTSLRLPPPSHPVWGVQGRMHGVVMKQGARRSYLLDPRYKKKAASVFGHNGFKPGDWWPMQVVALFNGAHGSMQGGISGSMHSGAYSIVVSNTYDDLDRDEGETLWYSGSKSHENKNPNSVGDDSNATTALMYSFNHGKHIRVLRSGNLNSMWAPNHGIRYDGLYIIVEERKAYNREGGLYRQFKLQRLPGQKPLQQVIRGEPNSAEQESILTACRAGY